MMLNFFFFNDLLIFGCAGSSLMHGLLSNGSAHRLLIVVAFLIAEHGLQGMRASVVAAS